MMAARQPRDDKASATFRDEGVAIYVLVDALGWEILGDRSFLDDLLPHRQKVQTILGYSSGAIPTLLTGRAPRDHGHWNLFYRSPETSPFRWTRPLLGLPEPVRESRYVRHVVKLVSHRLSGYTGYFAIYNLPLDRIRFYDICETTDIYRPRGLHPARSLFDAFVEGGRSYECYNYHSHTDAEILDLVPERLRTSDCRTYFLYLAGLDAYLHFHVSDPAGVSERLRWYERGLRRIHDAAAARWGRVRMHVFSDHGMTPVQQTRDLITLVEGLGLAMPENYLPAYDSTMARFWVFSTRAEEKLRALLGSLSWGRLLPEAELRALGIDFPDGRYGHLVFVMKPGVLICPSDMGRIRFDGMHGFHPEEDPHSDAVLLSTDAPRRSVRHISDLAAVVLADAGLPADEATGSRETVGAVWGEERS